MQPDQPALCGAFVLNGEPLDAWLPAASRDGMRACLPASEVVEFTSGCAWIAVSRGNLFETATGALAVSGLLLTGEDPARVEERLSSLLEGATDAAPADGHYALLHVRPSERTLVAYRDAAGGERLCYLVAGKLLLFASSVRLLLASGLHSAAMDPETVGEAVLSGHCTVIFGSRTLFEGVSELRPSQAMVVEQGRLVLRWLSNPVLRRQSGLPSPDELRDIFDRSVEKAVAGRKRLAVGLSGGLDSSTMAALAVQKLGAENVEGFTWEYSDPRHPSDAPYAAVIARALGIRHHVVRMSFRDYLDALVELMWRVEAPRFLPGARILLARAVRERGFDCLLDGVGMEGLVGDLEPFPYVAKVGALENRPGLEWWVCGWNPRAHRGLARFVLHHLGPWLHAPTSRDLFLTLCVLLHNGRIRDAGSAYNPHFRSFVQARADSPRVAEAIVEQRHKSLSEQFLHFHYQGNTMHRLLGGQRAGYAGAGAMHLSPCLFPTMLGRMSAWPVSGGRRVHCAAMRDELPRMVLERSKILAQATAPVAWKTRIGQMALPLVGSLLDSLDVHGEMREYMQGQLYVDLALIGLWREILVTGTPTSRPPTWGDLGLPYSD